jgi:arabinose-5-phosphate isomerase
MKNKVTYREHLSQCADNFNLLPMQDELEEVFEFFSNSKRIIFCTMGKSAFACRKIVYTARSYGLPWHDLDVCHAFHGDAGIISDGDLLVYVSKSGETRETIEVAKYFLDWKSISITSNPDSTLSKLCNSNINIPVNLESSPFGYAPMISTTMYMAVLHGIMCEVIGRKNLKVEDYARNHPHGNIGKLLVDNGII